MEIILLAIYAICLLLIFLYSISQASLTAQYLKSHKVKYEENSPTVSYDELPVVTVQLPIYNELYVVNRLLEAVSEFDYPAEKMEIQVLDDSTDETVRIIAQKVEELKAKGLDIAHICREDREGYKAGALDYGLQKAKGEFIAIFDADFVPDKEFIKDTLPHFYSDKVGMVQTKWEHLNKDYSMLTRLQAFALDGHFTVEQKGRNFYGCFMNFNGTAGMWRRKTIEDAGGWQFDTITEDMDLSYRAQMKGWKMVYLEGVSSPAEIPAVMDAVRSQQYRWNKGTAENARKNLLSVLKARLPLKIKFHAFFHLMNSGVFVLVFLLAVLSFPVLYLSANSPEFGSYFRIASAFILSFLILAVFYWNASLTRYDCKWKALRDFSYQFPMFLALSMGLSLHNAVAVLEGYLGRKTPFVRTPKFNIVSNKDKWNSNKYVNRDISFMALLEGALSIYFAVAVVLGIVWQDFGLLPFHLLLSFGFGIIFFYSVVHARVAKA